MELGTSERQANLKKALAMSKLGLLRQQSEAERFTHFRSQMQLNKSLRHGAFDDASSGKPVQKSRKTRKRTSHVETEPENRSAGQKHAADRRKAFAHGQHYSQSQSNFI